VLPPSSGIIPDEGGNYFTRQYIEEDDSELHIITVFGLSAYTNP
jgi:hypothetical protein